MKKIKLEFDKFYDKNKKLKFYLVNSKSTYPKLGDAIEVLPELYKVTKNKINLTPDIETYGTLLLEQFVIETFKNDVYIAIAKEQLISSLNKIKFDIIIAEDTGGDSLVKGIDIDNRDQIMLNILKKVTNSGVTIPIIHMIVSPGIDGESTFEEMDLALNNLMKTNYVTIISVENISTDLEFCKKIIKYNKTPILIMDSYDKWKNSNFNDKTKYKIVRYHGNGKNILCSRLAQIYLIHYI